MKNQNLIVYLWLILAIVSASSCTYYKRVEKALDLSSAEDEKLIMKQVYQSFDKESYLVLRQNDKLWHLSDVTLSEDRKTVTAKREKVSADHLAVIDNIKSKRVKKYGPSEKPYIHQTHLFVENYDFDEGASKVSIPIDNISKFEIYKYDITTSGLVTGTVLVIGGGIALVAVVALVCNCPYIYTEDDNQLVFEGNLFTGSIYPSLERTDYLPIKMKSSVSEPIKISVANENKEILNINQLSLFTVEHEPGVKVLIDQAGIPHTIINPISPIQSTSFKKYEHYEDLLHADGLAYDFADPEINPVSKMSEVDLVFAKSNEVDQGKLLLRLKNDNWGGLIYDEVSNMLGKRFNQYHNKEKNRSHKEMKEMMRKEGFLLSVSIFQDGLWQPIDYIWPTGSKAYRDVVIPVDFHNQEGDEIRIKLEGGFKFWDLDQAAIDFSEDLDVEIYESFAQSDYKEVEEKIITELRHDDELYMNQIQDGEKIDLQFSIQDQKEDSSYSYFVKGKGYYIVEKEYANRMKMAELLRFRKEGGFSFYSFKRFNEIAQSIATN